MKRLGFSLAFACATTVSAVAQGTPVVKAVSERVVVTGCLQLGDSLVGRPAAATREAFVLTDVTREPALPLPTDSGGPPTPSGVTASGSIAVAPSVVPSAVGTSGKANIAVYAVDGDVKSLAKRVGRRVEIIGTLGPATKDEFKRVNVSDVRSLGTCE